MYYYPFEPPYVLLVVGLLAALTCGSAFTATLKLIVQKWQNEGAENGNASLSIQQMFVPFLGIVGGLCLFLTSGLEIFGFPSFLAYAVGVPITLVMALLLWKQLGSMMALVERQGFQSLDLDSF